MSDLKLSSKQIKKVVIYLRDGSSIMVTNPRDFSLSESKHTKINMRTTEQNQNFQRGKSGTIRNN